MAAPSESYSPTSIESVREELRSEGGGKTADDVILQTLTLSLICEVAFQINTTQAQLHESALNSQLLQVKTMLIFICSDKVSSKNNFCSVGEVLSYYDKSELNRSGGPALILLHHTTSLQLCVSRIAAAACDITTINHLSWLAQ